MVTDVVTSAVGIRPSATTELVAGFAPSFGQCEGLEMRGNVRRNHCEIVRKLALKSSKNPALARPAAFLTD